MEWPPAWRERRNQGGGRCFWELCGGSALLEQAWSRPPGPAGLWGCLLPPQCCSGGEELGLGQSLGQGLGLSKERLLGGSASSHSADQGD